MERINDHVIMFPLVIIDNDTIPVEAGKQMGSRDNEQQLNQMDGLALEQMDIKTS